MSNQLEHTLNCPTCGPVPICKGCAGGPCTIALMPAEDCPCDTPGCQCHGPCTESD